MLKLLNLTFIGMISIGMMLNRAFDAGLAIAPLETNNNDLADLEDAYYHNTGEAELGVRLASEYRDRGEPELALAALRQMGPGATALPVIQHELSLAYADLGQLPEAVGSSRTAVARCARLLHNSGASGTSMCSEVQLTRMELQLSVMERLVKWGVVDPKLDPERTRRAYELSYRTARLATAPTLRHTTAQ